MRLSNMADYAVSLMSEAARHCGATHMTAALLSDRTGIPLPTSQKLVRTLVKADLLKSERGAGGGVRLARPAAAITLADIVEAVEGPIALTHCIDHAAPCCTLEGQCRSRPHWRGVNALVRDALAAVSLAHFHGPVTMPHEGCP